MNFFKYEGLGNDFIIIDALENSTNLKLFSNDQNLVRRICDRRFGIGADGLILLLPPDRNGIAKMEIFNSDGSIAEMCGNGIRCLVNFIHSHTEIKIEQNIIIETRAGDIISSLKIDNMVSVNMGIPFFEPSRIPTTIKSTKGSVPHQTISIESKDIDIYAVGMGNPHMVIFFDTLDNLPFKRLGTLLENHPNFPQKTNVHFAQVINPTKIKMKTWERGCGATLACGTGACGTLAVSSKLGLSESKAELMLPGGSLFINWPDSTKSIYMTGPALQVYEGKITL
ncbi:Diaminopimelate epimerase [Prochlorococcus sp. MIT 0603]|nr:Diaminopimelate epimerase [Prochlorococcus sp. MIT 0603]